MKTIACVYKSGLFKNSKTDISYASNQVRWLRDQVRRRYNLVHRFVCLTDVDIDDITTIKLRHNWPGWWSKMELHRPDLDFEDVFYLDLDTVLTGSIVPIVKHKHKFSILRNLSKMSGLPQFAKHNDLGSAVMAWNRKRHDVGYLYEAFLKSPEQFIKRYDDKTIKPHRWGDQGFLQDHLKKWDYMQDIFPGAIVSQKFGMDIRGNPRPDTKRVCFHGLPKPWEIEASWVPKLQ